MQQNCHRGPKWRREKHTSQVIALCLTIRLLFRFYDVCDGQITIDGHDVRDVSQDSLRRIIGIVPQDPSLFNNTISYNIAYAKPDSSIDEIIDVAKVAQIDEAISCFPNGYETKVGERGFRLSGGEKQRVAIARSILKGSPILVLDEASSSLDTKTERIIQNYLTENVDRKTIIMIAHRLSTVVNADCILLLKEGEIAEKGKHSDLLSQKGIYYDMWQKQIEEQEQRPIN
jgi:ABC-type transport system involved in Fe-S cluster assembly fused permease/ATPase subunit